MNSELDVKNFECKVSICKWCTYISLTACTRIIFCALVEARNVQLMYNHQHHFLFKEFNTYSFNEKEGSKKRAKKKTPTLGVYFVVMFLQIANCQNIPQFHHRLSTSSGHRVVLCHCVHPLDLLCVHPLDLLCVLPLDLFHEQELQAGVGDAFAWLVFPCCVSLNLVAFQPWPWSSQRILNKQTKYWFLLKNFFLFLKFWVFLYTSVCVCVSLHMCIT